MKIALSIVLSVLLVAGVVAANQLGAQTTSTSPAPTGTTGTLGTATLPAVQNVVEITRAVPAGATAVDAFTVPAGVTLVVTDIVVTNTGTAAACGGAVNRTGGAALAPTPTTDTTGTPPATGTTGTVATPTTVGTPPITTEGATGTAISTVTPTTPPTTSVTGTTATTTSAGTLTQTDSTVTGPLCVPAQTTTVLPLTTGIEFTGGQVVQLLNVPAAVATPGGTGTTGTPGPLAFHLRGVLMTAI